MVVSLTSPLIRLVERFGALAALAFAAAVFPAVAEMQPDARLPVPRGDAILVVGGSIARTTDGVAALFDSDMLGVIATAEGQDVSRPRWVVPLDALLAYVGGHGTVIEARTFDERRLHIEFQGQTTDAVLVIEPLDDDTGSDKTRGARVGVGLPGPDGDVDMATVIDRVVRLRID